ncbi:MAG: 50S ribosomal protein L23 [Bdellovibrionota bacterium]|nr:MAG: 50S ribosomal protein L23 [Pseudomonadota bacterium]
MNPYHVIVKPVLSEKSNEGREAANKYTFVIHKDATKEDVKKAVTAMWNLNATSVRTSIQRGKMKRRGQRYIQTPSFKKAIVSFGEGVKLPIFEDQ